MRISRLIQYLVAMLVLVPTLATAQNVKVDIMAGYILQRDYMISRPMNCDWDPSSTTIFGYYGTPSEPRTATPHPTIRTMQQPGDLKSQLSQFELEMPVREDMEMSPPYMAVHGLEIVLAFVPEQMERDGMPLHLVEIDYRPLNKDCPTGFGPGMLTR